MKKALKITVPFLGIVLLGFTPATPSGTAQGARMWKTTAPSASQPGPAAASFGVLGVGLAGILARRQRAR